MNNHANRPEIKAAFLKGKGISIRLSPTIGEEMLYYAILIKAKAPQKPMVLRAAISIANVQTVLNEVDRYLDSGEKVANLAFTSKN